MKQIVTFFAAIVFGGYLQAQTIQGTLKPGSSPNSVIIALKSSGALTGKFTNVVFTLQLPSSVSPVPTASIKTNPMNGASPNNFVPTSSYSTETTTEGGFVNYLFAAVPTGTDSYTFTAGTEVNVLEVQFSGGANGATAQVRLANLINGGANSNKFFYIEMDGADKTNLVAMFYGTGATNNGDYTKYSYIPVNNVVLPIRFSDFGVQRQVNDALINWAVSSDEEYTKYVVERSTDGSNFSDVADVAKTAGSGSKAYNFTDRNIITLGNKTVYYRVRSVDAFGRYTYTPIKSIRLDLKGNILLYPNPAKDFFKLSIPYLTPDQKRIQLHLVNSAGQILERKDITRIEATNYNYSLTAPSIVSGEYLLKIYEDGVLTDTKQVLIKK